MPIYINDKFKFVYFMIRKNASSSIRHFLLQNIRENPNLKYENWEDFINPKDLPMSNTDINTLKNYKDYYWFIFFRNPYDRVVSAYNDKVIAMLKDQKYESLYNPRMNMETFIDLVIHTQDSESDLHFRSQTIGMSKFESIKKFDFIGTVENLKSGIEKVKNDLGLKYDLKKLRKTKKCELSPIIKKKLYKRFFIDFVYFEKNSIYYNKGF